MFPLTPPRQLTFLISVLLAIAAVVVRYLVYTGVQMPPFLPTGGFLFLLVAYLVSPRVTCLKARRYGAFPFALRPTRQKGARRSEK